MSRSAAVRTTMAETLDLKTMKELLAQQTKLFNDNIEKQNEKLMQQMKEQVANEVSNQIKLTI